MVNERKYELIKEISKYIKLDKRCKIHFKYGLGNKELDILHMHVVYKNIEICFKNKKGKMVIDKNCKDRYTKLDFLN